MRLLALLSCATALMAQSQNWLPHQKPTIPGATNPEITQANVLKTICVPNYTQKERTGKISGAGPAPTPATKNRVYQRDGMTPSTATVGGKKVVACCEVDHLISLELGGSNSIDNLWAQPYKVFYGTKLTYLGIQPPAETYGAKEKDAVENYLHRAICKAPNSPGWLSLKDAQTKITLNWLAVYQEISK